MTRMVKLYWVLVYNGIPKLRELETPQKYAGQLCETPKDAWQRFVEIKINALKTAKQYVIELDKQIKFAQVELEENGDE